MLKKLKQIFSDASVYNVIVQMRLPDGTRQTCIDPNKINDTSYSESQQ